MKATGIMLGSSLVGVGLVFLLQNLGLLFQFFIGLLEFFLL